MDYYTIMATKKQVSKKKKADVLTEKFQPKKRDSLKILDLMSRKLSEKNLESFKDCSTYNSFIATESKEIHKLIGSNACKLRFCPICDWRKARKDAFMIYTMMKAIQAEQKYEFIFLTLTTPNVVGDDLKSEIDRFNKSFHKLFKRRNVMRSVKGYIRKLEVTHNTLADTYNPHFHVILAVNRSYFTDKNYYISQKKWLEMWRECTGMTGVTENGTDEITQLHIKKVQGLKEDNTISEVAKYSVKSFEMSNSEKVFNYFYDSLRGRQLITFHGVFKDYRQKFKSGELDKYKDIDTNEYIYGLVAEWNERYRKYERQYRLLSEEEKKRFNNAYEEETEVEDD